MRSLNGRPLTPRWHRGGRRHVGELLEPDIHRIPTAICCWGSRGLDLPGLSDAAEAPSLEEVEGRPRSFWLATPSTQQTEAAATVEGAPHRHAWRSATTTTSAGGTVMRVRKMRKCKRERGRKTNVSCRRRRVCAAVHCCCSATKMVFTLCVYNDLQ